MAQRNSLTHHHLRDQLSDCGRHVLRRPADNSPQRLMHRTFAKWLTSHCPHARRLLANCLLQRQVLEGALDTCASATQSGFQVTVETASGRRVGRFVFQDASTTIMDVSDRLRAHAPELFPTNRRLMLCRLGDATRLPRTASLAQVVGWHAVHNAKSTVVLVELVVMVLNAAWDPALSNPSLRWSDDARTAIREGGAGLLPRAVAGFELHQAGDGFGVELHVDSPTHEWSVGIAMNLAAFRPHNKAIEFIGRVEGTASFKFAILNPHGGSWFSSTTVQEEDYQKVELPLAPNTADNVQPGDCVWIELVPGEDSSGSSNNNDTNANTDIDGMIDRAAGGGGGGTTTTDDDSSTSWALRLTVRDKALCGTFPLPDGFHPPFRPVTAVSMGCSVTII